MERFLLWLQVIAYGRLENFKQRGRSRQNRKRIPIIVIGCEGNNKRDNAIKNAKKVEKHHLDLGQVLDNENCNPYIAAYKVVEEFIKRNNW